MTGNVKPNLSFYELLNRAVVLVCVD